MKRVFWFLAGAVPVVVAGVIVINLIWVLIGGK